MEEGEDRSVPTSPVVALDWSHRVSLLNSSLDEIVKGTIIFS